MDSLRLFPKVDLHRHLEGSLRLATVVEAARAEGLYGDWTPEQLRSAVQLGPQDRRHWADFLAKFDVLRPLYRSPALIRRVVAEAIEDAAHDGVRHLELRFTPATLGRARGYPLEDVFAWVTESAAAAARQHGISIRLLCSVNRHDPVDEAELVARTACDWMAQGVVGLDLAGNEVEFPAEPFRGIFQEAQRHGLGVTIHAGEWTGADSVRYALEQMQADRIAHGVRVLEDPACTALAAERGTCFEVCLTSNLLSGVVPSLDEHPLPAMIDAGLKVTLNTDDPLICGVQLSDEYRLAMDRLGLSEVSLAGMVLTAVQASFLTPKEKRDLEAALQPVLLETA